MKKLLISTILLAGTFLGISSGITFSAEIHECLGDNMCYEKSASAKEIHLFWNNDRYAYNDNYLNTAFVVNGTTFERGGKGFKEIWMDIKPGKSYKFMVTWVLKNIDAGYEYYIDSQVLNVEVPKPWDAFGAYKVGDKVSYQGRVHCALRDYQGHGDPTYIIAHSLWKPCNLL